MRIGHRFPSPPQVPIGESISPLKKHGPSFANLRGMRHRCPSCGCEDYWNFRVPDEIWKAVVPGHLQLGPICLQCFDKFAVARAISYARSLRELYFAGDMAAFRFAVVEASNGTTGVG